MTCTGYPSYTEGRTWCTDHGQWHYIEDVIKGIELLFDALESLDPSSNYDREYGFVSMYAEDLVRALLTAGWRVPEHEQERSSACPGGDG